MAYLACLCVLAFAWQAVLVSSARILADLEGDGGQPSPLTPSFNPVGLALGTEPQIETAPFAPFTLNSTTPFATIDYGFERAGYPVFAIDSLGGGEPVQFEVKYSEVFEPLAVPYADGPFAFSNGALCNTFRVETIKVTEPGAISSLLQPGQRWQSVRLLGNSSSNPELSISFKMVSFEASIAVDEPEQLPGKFSSSDTKLNEYWKLGARAATAACLEKGSQRATWEVDAEEGVRTTSQRPQHSPKALHFKDYTLEFETKILRSGSWWQLAGSFGNAKSYNLMLVSNLPNDTTYVNHDYALFPPNTVQLAYGFNFVNSSLPGLYAYRLESFPVPFEVDENKWYSIRTVASSEGYLSVSIDDQIIFNVSRYKYQDSSESDNDSADRDFSGSFGFGAYQDHEARFRNIDVSDTASGSALYTNPLTSKDDVLLEYGQGPNLASVCLDGPKRDRAVWLGDFYHTSRIIGTSTSNPNMSQSTLQFLLDTQETNGTWNGTMAIKAPMGYDPAQVSSADHDAHHDLQDYQILGLLTLYHHVRAHNDVAWLRETWPRWTITADWIIGKINATSNLIDLDSSFLGKIDGKEEGSSAIACAAVQAFKSLAELATALADDEAVTRYTTAAETLMTGINTNLWNERTGQYDLSIDNPSSFSIAGAAFCITSGTASPEQAGRILKTISRLRIERGYLDKTGSISDFISPNTNGFLLAAFFETNATELARDLLDRLWGGMIKGDDPAQNAYFTGASWEYISNSGTPSLGYFNSQSHPWGGAPTYLLTEYVAGIRPAKGVAGYGYGSWVVGPQAGVLDMGLDGVNATVVTAFGGDLSVQWKRTGGDKLTIEVVIQAPAGTNGTFVLGNTTRELTGQTRYEFSVDGV